MSNYRAPDFSQPQYAGFPDCRFVPAPKNATLPEGFMCTTNYPTYVKINGLWRLPAEPRMDAHLVWCPETDTLVVREFRCVQKGDLVAVAEAEDGTEGVLVWLHGFDDQTSHSDDEAFGFMRSETSREKPINYTRIFELFEKNRGDNGHIVWVVGPALVHARGREALIWLIQNGFVHCLLSGNAVGVHDIEAALFGSTLGMKADGSGEAGGHSFHMRAINAVKSAGSIKNLIEQGHLKSGIMHALSVANVPYVLAGSIRDDGPLPETITDALEAQGQMRKHTTRTTMVVMVATALHSIAVGNMLPTYCTKADGSIEEIVTICVDQTEFLVSKLKDRGTHQAFGVVTNAQDFMRLLQLELQQRKT